MDRLKDISWTEVSNKLQYTIYGCPVSARRDLMRLWFNLQDVAKEISKIEVTERRTMGSSGRLGDEKLEELQQGIKNLERMIVLACLVCC